MIISDFWEIALGRLVTPQLALTIKLASPAKKSEAGAPAETPWWEHGFGQKPAFASSAAK
jgi:hypothetical protein